MIKCLKAIIVITVIFGFFHICMLADVQRDIFGTETGNSLLIPEAVILGLFGTAIYFKKKQKRRLAIVAVLVSISCICFIIGWHIHPDRFFKRAYHRVAELEEYIDLKKIDFKTASPEKKKEIEVYLSRATTELMARKLELKAIEVRETGDPEYFRDRFSTHSWWFFSLLSVLAAICNFKLRKQHNNNL